MTTFRPDCMTPDELELWHDAASRAHPDPSKRATVPCVDCPVEWREVQAALGRCNTEEYKASWHRRSGFTRSKQNPEWLRASWRRASEKARAKRRRAADIPLVAVDQADAA
jgi:hypothetical protein